MFAKMVHMYVFIYEKFCLFVNIIWKIANQHSKFLLNYHVVYCFIRGSINLQSKLDTVQILFMDPCLVTDISLRISWKYLIWRIGLSAWIHTAAIVWISFTSSCESWSSPAWNEGMLTVTPKDSKCCFYFKCSIYHNVIIPTPEVFGETPTRLL